MATLENGQKLAQIFISLKVFNRPIEDVESFLEREIIIKLEPQKIESEIARMKTSVKLRLESEIGKIFADSLSDTDIKEVLSLLKRPIVKKLVHLAPLFYNLTFRARDKILRDELAQMESPE